MFCSLSCAKYKQEELRYAMCLRCKIKHANMCEITTQSTHALALESHDHLQAFRSIHTICMNEYSVQLNKLYRI